MDNQALMERARDALDSAYVPYSEYAVGAALETSDSTVYTGCNIEVANYSNSLHAEEVALGSAVRDGHRSFERVAVSSAARDGVTPCGMCRQSFAEFCAEDFTIVCEGEDGGDGESEGESRSDEQEDLVEYDLGTLLPETITREMVER